MRLIVNMDQTMEYQFERQGRKIGLLDGQTVEIWIGEEVVE